ncbi:hypothetical protein PTE01_12250 [Pseudoalteromonas tetraodonis GFC]|jgi:hypothetical protein|uniref:Uncharacterized protein n=1 Tax=Pseudoalteromonas tetraodonis GFC TaxID=1315271 RepID=A0AA37S655_9GAMM|nr:hypothetical protein [Pseudoalteromonas tetraodonis]ATD04862.1 hypothetical protein PTET_b0148 [Pseudoalteromonas tetraodonis]GEN38115.1 hypothetical protein PTE01_12250 [Pseudoalteromonas tetraodonis GFC]GLQ04181.1 hypothetical protein GCM10007914_30620 [Pseudoalteromonas tetraodonis GFC]
MKRYIVLTIAIPLSVFALYTLLNDQKKTDEVEAPIAIDIVPVDSEFAKKTHNPSPIDMSKDPIAAKPANIESNVPSNSFDAINKPSAKAKEILKAAKVLPTDLQNEAYIEFDLAALKTLKTGDNFDLAIPQTAETYSAEITNVTRASNGDKSIVGQVIGANGAMHTTILTVGNDAVYGQFTAPSGNYVFESKGQYGWIAAKRDLYKTHIEHQVGEPAPKNADDIDPFAPRAENTPSF